MEEEEEGRKADGRNKEGVTEGKSNSEGKEQGDLLKVQRRRGEGGGGLLMRGHTQDEASKGKNGNGKGGDGGKERSDKGNSGQWTRGKLEG